MPVGISICFCLHTHTHTHTHAHTQIHTHTHTQTNKQTHTQTDRNTHISRNSPQTWLRGLTRCWSGLDRSPSFLKSWWRCLLASKTAKGMLQPVAKASKHWGTWDGGLDNYQSIPKSQCCESNEDQLGHIFSFFDGVSLCPVPKWLLFLNQCGDWFSLPACNFLLLIS